MITTININIGGSEKPFEVDFEFGYDGITDVNKIENNTDGSITNLLPMYNSDKIFTDNLNEDLTDYLTKYFDL